MRKEENLAATSQLLRFIRGGITCEEFYTRHPDMQPQQKSGMAWFVFPLLAGLALILIGYLIVSWQLKADQSQLAQLDMVYRDLESVKNLSPQDIEARQAFWHKQEALYQDLIGEKLSMSCIFKELSHLCPPGIFFRRISLKEAPPKQQDKKYLLERYLILEGRAIRIDASENGDFPTFLTRLNQSSFFQKVHVDSQTENDTDRDHGLDFILTCDLK
ncbi:MAG: PilN domain-containing protein [bacterium]